VTALASKRLFTGIIHSFSVGMRDRRSHHLIRKE
jgi:hypothetical protein